MLLQAYYKVDESMEEEANNVLIEECKRLLQNTRHEMRVQAIRDYYAQRGKKLSKKDCCKKYLKREQYMMVINPFLSLLVFLI